MPPFHHSLPRPVLAAGLLAALLAACPAHAADVSKEYQLKAAFLYNFVKFVEWPPALVHAGSGPIIVGIVGTNPFGEELGNAVRGRKVDGHPIVVKFAPNPNGAKGANVVFIPAAMAGRVAELNRTFGAGVLIVGDSKQMIQQGATIAFQKEGDKLRFVVNVSEASRDGLKISAQLLKLASEIQR